MTSPLDIYRKVRCLEKKKKKKGSSDFFSSRLFGSLIKVFKVSSEQGFPDLLVFVSPLHSPGVFNQ